LFQVTIILEPVQPVKNHQRQSEAENYHSTARLQNKEKEQKELLAQKTRVCKETLTNLQRSQYFRKPSLKSPVIVHMASNGKEKSKAEHFHEFEDFSDEAIQNRKIPSKEQAARGVDELLSEVSLFLFLFCSRI
jgi:hypothetical protein